MQVLKGLFFYLVLPIALLVGAVIGFGKINEKMDAADKQKADAAIEALCATPEGYAQHKVKAHIQLYVDSFDKQASIKGRVENHGARNLRNVRVHLVWLDTAKAGQSRLEYADLGPIGPDTQKVVDVPLGSSDRVGNLYDLSKVSVTF